MEERSAAVSLRPFHIALYTLAGRKKERRGYIPRSVGDHHSLYSNEKREAGRFLKEEEKFFSLRSNSLFA